MTAYRRVASPLLCCYWATYSSFKKAIRVWYQSSSQNDSADVSLLADLAQRGVWHARVEGFSSETGHAEPGWAAAIAFEQACQLGERFHQDAIYFVRDDILYVSFCDERASLAQVSRFSRRLVRL